MEKINIEKILKYLGVAESTNLHKNSTETDITTPYGIYRAANKNAEVFVFIDSIAASVGIKTKSSLWSSSEIERVNSELRSAGNFSAMKSLISKFYLGYFEPLKLEKFHADAQVAIVSTFTTSKEGGVLSVQRTINSFIKMGFISTPLLVEDGAIGNKTYAALDLILPQLEGTIFGGLYFEEKVLGFMSDYYDDLAYNNPAKYGKYRKGWRSRLKALKETR